MSRCKTMVQEFYCCCFCYSNHQAYLTISTHPENEGIISIADLDSKRKTFWFSYSSCLLILDIFIKLYNLLVKILENVISNVCYFPHGCEMPFSKNKGYDCVVSKCNQRKEFFLRNMKHKNVEVVKVKTQTKSGNTLDENHYTKHSIVTGTQYSRRKSKVLLVLLAFLNFISTTQSVTGKRQH